MDVTEDDTPIYDLQQQASRLQGLIMTIDFLGKTEEALSYTGKTPPFSDLNELDEKSIKYVSYAIVRDIPKASQNLNLVSTY